MMKLTWIICACFVLLLWVPSRAHFETETSSLKFRWDCNRKVMNLSYPSETTTIFEFLTDDMFTEYKDMEVLDLSGQNLTSISNHLAPLGDLRELYLQNNKIKTVDRLAFRNLNKLEVLDLSGNQLKEIQSSFNRKISLSYIRALGTFDSLGNLRELNLARNQLDELDRTLFEKLENLEYLNLESNQIREIPFQTATGFVRSYILPGLFDSLKKLKTLILSHNHISELKSGVDQQCCSVGRGTNLLGVLSYCEELRYLDLTENKGTDDQEIVIDPVIKQLNSKCSIYHNGTLYHMPPGTVASPLCRIDVVGGAAQLKSHPLSYIRGLKNTQKEIPNEDDTKVSNNTSTSTSGKNWTHSTQNNGTTISPKSVLIKDSSKQSTSKKSNHITKFWFVIVLVVIVCLVGSCALYMALVAHWKRSDGKTAVVIRLRDDPNIAERCQLRKSQSLSVGSVHSPFTRPDARRDLV